MNLENMLHNDAQGMFISITFDATVKFQPLLARDVQ